MQGAAITRGAAQRDACEGCYGTAVLITCMGSLLDALSPLRARTARRLRKIQQ